MSDESAVMAGDANAERTRFPWGYLAAALLPAALLVALLLIPALLPPQQSMTPAMLCSLLIGPVGAIVAGFGVVRLACDDGQEYPALRWLVWLSAGLAVAGIALG